MILLFGRDGCHIEECTDDAETLARPNFETEMVLQFRIAASTGRVL